MSLPSTTPNALPTQQQELLIDVGNSADAQEVQEPTRPQEPTDFKLFSAPTTSQSSNGPAPYRRAPTAGSQGTSSQRNLGAPPQTLGGAPVAQPKSTQGVAAQPGKGLRWPQTSIRIKFSDRSQLEKVFPSTNKIMAVYDFVQSCLRDDIKQAPFVLYQPPRFDLKQSDPKVRDQNLAKLQLAPSSVLLVRFENDALNRPDAPSPLSQFVLRHAMKLPPAVEMPGPPPEKPFVIDPVADLTNFVRDLKVPKWFKDLGK